MNVALTYWPRLRNPVGQRVRTTWAQLVARLSAPRVVASKLDIPGFALATFVGDKRALANVEHVYAVGLDLDEGVVWETLLEKFGATASFLHTTWSSTAEAPRARVFLPLSRPVSGAEYRRVYAAVAGVAEAGGLVVDRAASDPSRLWFLPAIKPGGAFRFSVGDGAAVNVDGALAAVPPAPPPPPPFVPSTGPTRDVEERAAKYIDRCEPAISGQGGHNATFLVCQKIVRGFGLDEETAYRLLAEWNSRCEPPWSERELRRKIRQAAQHGRMVPGELRDARRRAS